MGVVEKTIAAVATPPGRGGIGIIRVSGSAVRSISQALLGMLPTPRFAHFCTFRDDQGDVLDEGIALFFPAPHSFTGEDILELQGHGGSIVLHRVLRAVCAAGAVLANPGEFSERAFLNGKMDLIQAEAVADLIDASSIQAAQSALRSLQGEFSKKIDVLLHGLTRIRVFIESAMDFSEEEIDFLTDSSVLDDLNNLEIQLQQTLESAHQGVLLRDGITLVILGVPNVGKSSLLNCLAAKDAAIVTDIAGTTRDVLRATIQIEGMPIHVVDTAGLRQSDDAIEQEGVRRAWLEARHADVILVVVDGSDYAVDVVKKQLDEVKMQLSDRIPVVLVFNKIDKLNEGVNIAVTEFPEVDHLKISATRGDGIEGLKSYLKDCVGLQYAQASQCSARDRHVNALERVLVLIQQGRQNFTSHSAVELLAEDLRIAQQHLSEVTGKFTTDDLLGNIFSTFCVGK